MPVGRKSMRLSNGQPLGLRSTPAVPKPGPLEATSEGLSTTKAISSLKAIEDWNRMGSGVDGRRRKNSVGSDSEEALLMAEIAKAASTYNDPADGWIIS